MFSPVLRAPVSLADMLPSVVSVTNRTLIFSSRWWLWQGLRRDTKREWEMQWRLRTVAAQGGTADHGEGDAMPYGASVTL